MALSLAEKALLLLCGVEPQGQGQVAGNSMAVSGTETFAYSRVVGALLMDGLLRQRIHLKRAAIYVRCFPCYLALSFGMVFLGLAPALGSAALYAVHRLSFIGAIVLGVALYVLFCIAVFIIAHRTSGRLLIGETGETSEQDELSALLLQRMRETGQAKTCQTYFRRLMRFGELRARVEEMRTRLTEQGYLETEKVSGSIGGTSLLRHTMNLKQPECQELRDTFRDFLLTGNRWDEHVAALAILLCPRLPSFEISGRPQGGWFTLFTRRDYPLLRARFKAIRAQQEQTIPNQLGVTMYQALLTVRNLLPN